jgi:hypothetical protein
LAGRRLDVGLGSVTGGRREKIVDADVRESPRKTKKLKK